MRTPIELCGAVMAAILMLTAGGMASAETAVPRVRALDSRMAALLGRGTEASPTLAALVESLERSDVIVHVEEQRHAWRPAPGETRFVARAGGFRYVRIGIAPTVVGDAAVALLAHELYHAWEIAQARWAYGPVISGGGSPRRQAAAPH